MSIEPTLEERISSLKAHYACLDNQWENKCDANCDNCSLTYEIGHHKEFMQNLDMAIQALEKQKELAEYDAIMTVWTDNDVENLLDDFLIDELKEVE